jgi:hypothetical protein
MDYDKLTKAELIDKLNEQKHLAQAVNAKDKEIVELKKRYETRLEQVTDEVNQLKKDYQGALKKEEIDKIIKTAEDQRKESSHLAQFYVKMYHDFLKQTQQNLEMALFTEQLVSEKFKK